MRGLLGLAIGLSLGCGAIVHGSALSDRGELGDSIYLSTGGSPRPFKTLGFVQITGEGRTFAGVLDLGDAAIDGLIHGNLVEEAKRMGGDGVIHIEFSDLNPPTNYERYQQAAQTAVNLVHGKGTVSEQRRLGVVTGEVIQFVHR